MRNVILDSWEQFPQKIKSIENEFALNDPANNNKVLWRGHSDSRWILQTTLERYSKFDWSVESYTNLLKAIKPYIESFTSERWVIDNEEIPWEESSELPCHELWVFVRHLGFPSPLIDWTLSPYIAAFFAFEEVSDADSACVYAYIEAPGGNKIQVDNAPHITIQTVNEKTHKRHFLQQSNYTICTAKEKHDNHKFISHDEVFSNTLSTEKRQDILLKLILPRSERLKVLSELNKMNINHFSLFQSEESLMRTLALKEIDLIPYLQVPENQRTNSNIRNFIIAGKIAAANSELASVQTANGAYAAEHKGIFASNANMLNKYVNGRLKGTYNFDTNTGALISAIYADGSIMLKYSTSEQKFVI
jgi:hypothetical protein